MGNVSTEWLAAISTGRDYSIDEKKKGCAVPVTPWLHPPVGKRLRDLIPSLEPFVNWKGRRFSIRRAEKFPILFSFNRV